MTTTDWRTRRRGPYLPREGRARDSISPASRHIIDQLIRARREADMTQTDVAQAIGKGLHHISEMEAGRKETSLDIIAAYARAVDLPWIEIP